MTPYTPRTVWATLQPALPKPRPPRPCKTPQHGSSRVYRKGQPSGIAQLVLEYVKDIPGATTQEMQRVLNIKSVWRQVNTLEADGLVTTSMHENSVGRPFKRVWIKEDEMK